MKYIIVKDAMRIPFPKIAKNDGSMNSSPPMQFKKDTIVEAEKRNDNKVYLTTTYYKDIDITDIVEPYVNTSTLQTNKMKYIITKDATIFPSLIGIAARGTIYVQPAPIKFKKDDIVEGEKRVNGKIYQIDLPRTTSVDINITDIVEPYVNTSTLQTSTPTTEILLSKKFIIITSVVIVAALVGVFFLGKNKTQVKK